MGLKEFRDDWETWSKGKKVVSIIIGCCVLTLVFSAIFGLLAPDANSDYYDSGDDTYVEDDGGPFIIDESGIKVKSSKIDITDQQTKSSSYAYFYEDTGAYAEAAYTTYTAEDINIKIDFNKLKLSNSSTIEYEQFFSDPDVYNETNLVKDITKLLKSDDVSVELTCYDKNGYADRTFFGDQLKTSMKDGILTVKYSHSNTSDYHTKYADSTKLDHARLSISGTINGTNSTRPIDFNLVTKNMDVKFHK